MSNAAYGNRQLFVADDGSPLVFHIPPGQTKKELTPLIECHGGVVTSKHLGPAIKLADKSLGESAVKYKDLFWSSYVLDCVNQNIRLDLEQYRCSTGSHQMRIMADSDNENDMAPARIIISKQRSKKGRLFFSKTEDLTILRYVVENRLVDKTKGKNIWKEMNRLKITMHSAESMRSHFLHKIMKSLDAFDIPASWKSYLTGNTAMTVQEPAVHIENACSSDSTTCTVDKFTAGTKNAREDNTPVVAETEDTQSDTGSLNSSYLESNASAKNPVPSACSNSTDGGQANLHHAMEPDVSVEEYDEFDRNLIELAQKSSHESSSRQSSHLPEANSRENVSEEQEKAGTCQREGTDASEVLEGQSACPPEAAVTARVSLHDSGLIFDSDKDESQAVQKKQVKENYPTKLKRKIDFQQEVEKRMSPDKHCIAETAPDRKHKKKLFNPETHGFSVGIQIGETASVGTDASVQRKSKLDKSANTAADSHGQMPSTNVTIRKKTAVVSKHSGKATTKSPGKKSKEMRTPSKQAAQKLSLRRRVVDQDSDESVVSSASDVESLMEKSMLVTSSPSSEKLPSVPSSPESGQMSKSKQLSASKSSQKKLASPSLASTPKASPRKSLTPSRSSAVSQRSKSGPQLAFKNLVQETQKSNTRSPAKRLRLDSASSSDTLENESFHEDKLTVQLLAEEFGLTLSESWHILWWFSGSIVASRCWILSGRCLRGHYLWRKEDDKAILDPESDSPHLAQLIQQRGQNAVDRRRQWLQED